MRVNLLSASLPSHVFSSCYWSVLLMEFTKIMRRLLLYMIPVLSFPRFNADIYFLVLVLDRF